MSSPRTPHREHAMTKDGRREATFNLASPFHRDKPQRLRYTALNGTFSSAQSRPPPKPESSIRASRGASRDSDLRGFKSMSSSGLGSSSLRHTCPVAPSGIRVHRLPAAGDRGSWNAGTMSSSDSDNFPAGLRPRAGPPVWLPAEVAAVGRLRPGSSVGCQNREFSQPTAARCARRAQQEALLAAGGRQGQKWRALAGDQSWGLPAARRRQRTRWLRAPTRTRRKIAAGSPGRVW
jgi:hypothetical protein